MCRPATEPSKKKKKKDTALYGVCYSFVFVAQLMAAMIVSFILGDRGGDFIRIFKFVHSISLALFVRCTCIITALHSRCRVASPMAFVHIHETRIVLIHICHQWISPVSPRITVFGAFRSRNGTMSKTSDARDKFFSTDNHEWCRISNWTKK